MTHRPPLVRVVALTTSLAVVGLAGLSSSPSRATDYHPEYGSVAGISGELLRGCHSYTYAYSVTPPEGQWALETFITGPHGESVASGAFLEGSDPESGTGSFDLCVPTAHSGTYTINGKVSVDGDGTPSHVEGFVVPATFTLIKQKKKHHKKYTLGPIHVRR